MVVAYFFGPPCINT